MRLYVLQHAEAVPEEMDPDRPLTPRGWEQMGRLSILLGSRCIRVSRLLHSGKTRARQTAEILAPKVLPGGVIEEWEGLKPKDSPDDFLRGLGEWEYDLMLVGHMPFVSKLVSRLVTGKEEPAILTFSPGTLAALETDPGKTSWTIGFLWPPELL